jgi:hypothetical protein
LELNQEVNLGNVNLLAQIFNARYDYDSRTSLTHLPDVAEDLNEMLIIKDNEKN